MAIKTRTFHIATCDVCGAEFDETGDHRYWDDSPELAIAQVRAEPDSHWRIVAGRVVCPARDIGHDEVRGGDSPLVLQPTTDAMVADFGEAA